MHLSVSGYGPNHGLRVLGDSGQVGELKFPFTGFFLPELGRIWLGPDEYRVRTGFGLLNRVYRMEFEGQTIADGRCGGEVRMGGRRYLLGGRHGDSVGPLLLVYDALSNKEIGRIFLAKNGAESDFTDDTDYKVAVFMLWLAGHANDDTGSLPLVPG